MLLSSLTCELLLLKNQYLKCCKRVCRQDQLNHTAETDWLEEYGVGKRQLLSTCTSHHLLICTLFRLQIALRVKFYLRHNPLNKHYPTGRVFHTTYKH